MDFTADQIAHVVHEANRVLQRITGDAVLSRSWWEAPQVQREGLVHGVQKALEGATPEELHEEWVRYRAARGWKYGRLKDEHARTHPCMVPFDQLPPEQQMKDRLFHAIVHTLAGHLVSVEKA
jgi:hypothetical protein